MKYLLLAAALVLAACDANVKPGNQQPPEGVDYHYFYIGFNLQDGTEYGAHLWMFYQQEEHERDECVTHAVATYFSDLDRFDIVEMREEYEMDLPATIKWQCGEDIYIQGVKLPELIIQ